MIALSTNILLRSFLFFIDDIYSYRQDEKSDKETYLKNTFERLLLEKNAKAIVIDRHVVNIDDPFDLEMATSFMNRKQNGK